MSDQINVIADLVRIAEADDDTELMAIRLIPVISELIEAATDAHDFAANTARNDGKELDRRFYRLRAALVRAGVGS